jgi:phage-related protein
MSAAARAELLAFPGGVRCQAAYALRVAEEGEVHPAAKPLKGFGGASVMEVVLDDSGDTYRVMYTVQFKEVTVLLHAFEKKSKKGIATPKGNMKLIEKRLMAAKEMYGGR